MEVEKKSDDIIIPIKKETSPRIKKIDSGTYHNGKHLLYEPDTEWKCICCNIEKDMVIYLGKYSISLLVLLFCFYMLQNTNNDEKSYYTAQISFILGVYVGVNSSNNNNGKDKKQ